MSYEFIPYLAIADFSVCRIFQIGLCCLLTFGLIDCRKFDHFVIILLLFCFLFGQICLYMLALHLEGIILIVMGVIQRHCVAEFVILVLTRMLSLKEFSNVMAYNNQCLYLSVEKIYPEILLIFHECNVGLLMGLLTHN